MRLVCQSHTPAYGIELLHKPGITVSSEGEAISRIR
jgi:hypothetical protein